MHFRHVIAAMTSTALALGALTASAKSGEVTILHCSGSESRTITEDAQHAFGIGNSIGTVRSNPPGGMFDVMTSRCLGAFRVVDGKPSLWGHCE